jgi:hypothetical protein
VAIARDSLKEFYQELRDDGKVEPLAKRAPAIEEKALGSDHSDVSAGFDKSLKSLTIGTNIFILVTIVVKISKGSTLLFAGR